MSPDTPALRGLLQAVRDALAVPTPASPSEDTAAARLLAARAESVRVITGHLAGGVLDNVAIQDAARTLTAVTRDLTAGYEVAW